MVVEPGDGRDAFDSRRRGTPADVDDDDVALVALARDLDLALTHEPGVAGDEAKPFARGGEPPIETLAPPPDDGVLACDDGGEVHSDALDLYAQPGRRARHVRCAGARDERLRRGATVIDTRPAQPRALDEEHAAARGREAPGERHAGLAGADDDGVHAHEAPPPPSPRPLPRRGRGRWFRPLHARMVRRGARQRTVLLVPLLVVVLRHPERSGRRDLGGDRVREMLLLLRPRCERGRELLWPEGEDGRPVLAPAVRALPVAARRIVRLPEELQQLGVADLARVELDEDRLRLPRSVGADVLVARILRVATRVADRRGDDASHLPEALLHAPEAALREDGEPIVAGWGERRAVADVPGARPARRIADHELLSMPRLRGRSEDRARGDDRDHRRARDQVRLHGLPPPWAVFSPADWNSERYWPYPSCASRSTGTKRRAAEFMQ